MLYTGNEIDYPEEDDVVSIHIKMVMLNADGTPGNVLENSRKRRRPFRFKVNGGAVVPGEPDF